MDQVQILKGPASINFGLVAPGGMVNLVTKRPEAESFARASMTYGSYSLRTYPEYFLCKSSLKKAKLMN